ncbi:hypothetical protein GV794_12830 [Nocardia cyriacigeorgica]|uniref:Uncharacterized protein n=1 Tax=Nocardia cyriacigeorgica TaxID=135487 RepID=A0A6P1D4Z8_9NOCA|nr:hypothetical protein [Nocardia cyriacigeorgica]NEW39569.1 hypothetical protein [Nocardia cyriacigeorgica]NEW43983.1 hypothetical protein [Nocardia cyriacigeorgica]NEW50058.1 hypothetical protein [Nocardia cyriacigeorgica]NEW56531.1 hypothetical protein [Nocardia cyriacigeorgica]
MHTLVTNLNSLWKVVAAGLVFGAGLPMIFAFGVRFWTASENRTDGGVVQRNYPALAGALVCLGLVIAAVVTGVLYTAKAFLAARFGIHLFGES